MSNSDRNTDYTFGVYTVRQKQHLYFLNPTKKIPPCFKKFHPIKTITAPFRILRFIFIETLNMKQQDGFDTLLSSVALPHSIHISAKFVSIHIINPNVSPKP